MSDMVADRRELTNVLHLPYETVEYHYRSGRLAYVNWRLFQTLWAWSAPRLAGEANRRQAEYAIVAGWDATFRKIERTARLIEAISRGAGGQPRWPVHVTPAPFVSRTIAYGNHRTVQIFEEFENASPALLQLATALCREHAGTHQRAMVCIDDNQHLYVEVY